MGGGSNGGSNLEDRTAAYDESPNPKPPASSNLGDHERHNDPMGMGTPDKSEKDRVGGDRRMEVETQGKNRAGRHGNGA